MSDLSLFEHESLIDFILNKGNGVKGLSQLNLKTIPNQFIQPPQERLHPNQIAAQESVPIIDFSNWDDPKVAESICDAASKWGFFQIINHGIPLEVLENVKQAAHDFFNLPVVERRNYLKENTPSQTVQLRTSFSPQVEKPTCFTDYSLIYYVLMYTSVDDLYNCYFMPYGPEDQVLEYINWAKPVIRKLLEILLSGINVEKMDEVKESALMASQIVSLLYYPVCPNPDLASGAGPHADISSLTFLLQDDVGGLYVRANECDKWIHVEPVKGAFVVNIGDVLQIMSNDRYKSIEHRVLVSGSKNRVSVPIFVNPAPNASIGPLPEVLEAGEKPIYKQIVHSDYYNYFFSKAHDGKQTINYAKI
ncbi:hypothetical protein RD792_003123 [Penstemon davidsonii]|uniref:Fe2OG dioxygenase domain-containing protein n=1 Tax=Penstemon davidsonii TaxID=160366 RepID=A0ABR0DT15_9LAMI|nr:hypothetical protein RD792_003123 [Penstemon davidsonii]